MGVMDFLKGLFSSGNDEQSVNTPSEPSSLEPTPEEPKVEDMGGNEGESKDPAIQE